MIGVWQLKAIAAAARRQGAEEFRERAQRVIDEFGEMASEMQEELRNRIAALPLTEDTDE